MYGDALTDDGCVRIQVRLKGGRCLRRGEVRREAVVDVLGAEFGDMVPDDVKG